MPFEDQQPQPSFRAAWAEPRWVAVLVRWSGVCVTALQHALVGRQHLNPGGWAGPQLLPSPHCQQAPPPRPELLLWQIISLLERLCELRPSFAVGWLRRARDAPGHAAGSWVRSVRLHCLRGHTYLCGAAGMCRPLGTWGGVVPAV